jgi:putative ABC transport system permease protein
MTGFTRRRIRSTGLPAIGLPPPRHPGRAGDQSFWEKGFFIADDGFFDLFDFPLFQGNPNTVLANPNAVVISEAAARKYFGTDDPIGKQLTVENKFELTVVGLTQDMPSNAHFRCDFLTSFATLETLRY